MNRPSALCLRHIKVAFAIVTGDATAAEPSTIDERSSTKHLIRDGRKVSVRTPAVYECNDSDVVLL